MDAGVAIPLVKLLSDESIDVQVAATASLCNIVLDFSAMKRMILEKGAIQQIVVKTRSSNNELRLNGVWALKNLVYMANTKIKEAVMMELTYDHLFNLLYDQEPNIQEQALAFLRNLVYKDPDIFLEHAGKEKLLKVLENISNTTEKPQNIKQILYTICNIATGKEDYKSSIMANSSIIDKIIFFLDSHTPAQIPAIWSVIQLTWAESAANKTIKERVLQLKQMGCNTKLQNVLATTGDNEFQTDVQTCAKIALQNFQKIDGL